MSWIKKLPFCVLLCLALVLPAFAYETPRLYFVCENAPTGAVLQTLQLAAGELEAEGFCRDLAYGEAARARENDFLITENSALPEQGYRISDEGLAYADEEGLFYGLRRVLKMMRSGRITDVTEYPLVRQRVLMLDCARKYFSKNFILNLIRQMSHMGMNALELHLTEEQGIRLDIWDEDYFQSENDHSWIVGSQTAYWVYDCPDPDAGKFLTAAEMVEILETAKQYHVEIIPSVNTPGHSEYLCDVFAQSERTFLFDGKSYTASSIASDQYSVIDLNSEAARAFAQSVLLDYAGFFAAYGCKNFNLCADEVSLGGAMSYDLFTEYVNDTANRLQALGYRVRAFNDFLGYDYATVPLDENVDIVYWHTPYPNAAAKAEDFIAQGRMLYHAVQDYSYYALRVFNSPGYEDHASWGLDARDENNTWWAFNRATAERIYAEYSPCNLFEPADATQTVLRPPQLAGSYFLIWCDYAGLADEAEIWSGEYPLLERLWAHNAKLWHCELPQEYDEFARNIAPVYEFTGFSGCSDVPNKTPSVRASYADCMATVKQVEIFRQIGSEATDAAYQELAETKLFPYGPFGRKRP